MKSEFQKNMKFLLYIFFLCIFQRCKIVNAKSLVSVTETTQSRTSIKIEAESNQQFSKKIQIVEDFIPSSNYTCETSDCTYEASKILEYLDPEVDPCDNFYKFACGRFLRNTIVSNESAEVDIFNIISNKIEIEMIALLEEPSQPGELKPFTKDKTLYKACKDEATIEKEGLSPIINILKTLGGWPIVEEDLWRDQDFDWKQTVYKLRNLGFSHNYFFDLHVDTNQKNTSANVVTIDRPTMIMEMSEVYLKQGLNHTIVNAYYNYMVDIAVIFGANRTRAEQELKESLEFEINLTNISLAMEERRNLSILYNLMSLKELAENYSSIPWKEYCNTILKPHTELKEDDVVIVTDVTFFKKFENLIKETPKRVQANYAIWRTVADSIDYLTKEIQSRKLKFKTETTGEIEQKSRQRQCFDYTLEQMGLAHSALYIRNFFNEESKKSMKEIIKNIRQQYLNILQNVNWMDENTRKSALEKMETMGDQIGFPAELLDDKKLDQFYKNLEITPGNFFQGILNVSLFRTEYSLSLLREPVKKWSWVSEGENSIFVNAFYNVYLNSIEIPAGILRGAFFNANRPLYMNYGAIGYIVGHEITHGFDDMGSQYDKDGKLFDWWESETKEKYLGKFKCFIDQYGNYTSEEVGLKVNGFNTLPENLADNGGIKVSYLAYQEWVNQNGPEKSLPGLNYSPSQLFWISAAYSRCNKYRTETLKYLIMTETHSPAEFRVLGPFQNRPEFSKDFNCPLGSKMNPIKKCSVW